MVAASQYPDPVAVNLVDQPMRLINAPGPTTLQFVFQRLRLANTRKRLPLNLTNQTDDAECLGAIFFHPPGEVLKRRMSNSRLFRDILERHGGLPSGSLQEASFHRFALEQIWRFPL